jgi:hypothetical protein
MPLIRVRKEHVKTDSWIKPDGFDICMACWQDYMRLKERDHGVSRVHLVGGAEDPERVVCESDPYAEQRKDDLKVGKAANAAVNSLSRLHYWAIYKAYGMGQVWIFPNADFLETLEAAKAELEQKLRRNAVTAVKF